MSEAQIIQLRDIILSASENKEYRDVFSKDIPKYDPEKNLWVFNNGFPRTPGGNSYTFEFREADGHYRLGWVSEYSSSHSHERFRIQPKIRRKLTKLLKEISQNNRKTSQVIKPKKPIIIKPIKMENKSQ
jgi:hypothetical protein